jgi:hypothetical protein
MTKNNEGRRDALALKIIDLQNKENLDRFRDSNRNVEAQDGNRSVVAETSGQAIELSVMPRQLDG